MKILGRTFRALLDSGSIANLIGSGVVNHLQQHGVEPVRESVNLCMADGNLSNVKLSYRIFGEISERSCTWDALYLPSLTTDLVIGMSTITELQLISFNTKLSGEHVGTRRNVEPINALTSLTEAQKRQLTTFLNEELPLFNKVSGKTHLIEHKIRLKDGVVPIKQRYYPRNPKMQEIIDQDVKEMLKDGVIEPSNSPWSSPIVLVQKSTGKYRFCVDMREVNTASVKDAYPLPRIDAILDKLRHARILSTIDLRKGYWQVPLAEESRPITAFTVPGLGLFQFRCMPFGLHSAGATFQRLLDQIIGPELEPRAFAYLDDLILVSADFSSHLELLRTVFKKTKGGRLANK